MAENSRDRSGAPSDKQKADAARKNMSDYEAAAVALRAKTERLRALRLAREAAEHAAAPPKAVARPKAAKPAKSSKGPKAPSVTLAEWLRTERSSGRNS
jgi:hypothetical protein